MSESRTSRSPVVPRRRAVRCVQDGIPPEKGERDDLRRTVEAFVCGRRAAPPISAAQLGELTDGAIAESGAAAAYRDFVTILVHNALWRDAVAGVPYDRRLLLLPQCLRDADHCPGTIDAYGLLCRRCGRCVLADLHQQAEALGYAVMVAEGSAVVMSLIESGRIEAVVGVSCLSVLEQVYPYMEAAAVPGLAIPLLQDGCRDTSVDTDWLMEVIHLSSEHPFTRLNLDGLRDEVAGWFMPAALREVPGPPDSQTERIAHDWLARGGKRWRPFLTVAAYRAVCDDPDAPFPATVRRSAVAVECFHKASLAHDDIEDAELQRYGRASLHAAHGVPVALNVGDLLLGEGYRLLAGCGPDAATMLAAAAQGHRALSVGQGAELLLRDSGRPAELAEVLAIFRRKTAPAFEVALRVGVALAGAGDGLDGAISQYSEALGVAYQIRDDLRDVDGRDGDAARHRPSVVTALARQSGRGSVTGERLAESGAAEEAWALMESYKARAVAALSRVDHVAFKCLLRRILGKVFCDAEVMLCCRDVGGEDG